jgi:predicted phage gp36 major capsid-like protein
MTSQTVARQLENLDRRVTLLEQLPSRIEALEWQVSQLRDEMRAEFSAVRGEMKDGNESLGRTLREEMKAGNESLGRTLREEMKAGNETLARELRAEMRQGNEELRSHMMVLHEEVMARFALLDETRTNGRSGSAGRARPRGNRR